MRESSPSQEEKRPQKPSSLLDPKLNLLANHRRRTILRILLETDDGSIEFSDLATEIVSREDGDLFVDRDMVIIDLHHKDLPKLVEAGIAKYDQRSGTVRYQEDGEIEYLLAECSQQQQK